MRFLHRYLSNTVSGAASFPGQDLPQIDRALRYSADKNREGENSLQRHKTGKTGPGYVGCGVRWNQCGLVLTIK